MSYGVVMKGLKELKLSFPYITDNQMEKNMEHEMGTGLYGLYQDSRS